jgi:hypothetical protein
VGLAVSLVVHLVALGLAGRWLEQQGREVARAPEPLVVEIHRGMRAVAISETGAPDREAVAERPAVSPPRETVRVERPVTPEERPPATQRRTAAERLAPRVVEPGLWAPRILLPREPTIQDVQDRIAAAIEMLGDSALAETERALRARDWTVEDARGGRWGISPGQLHLGSVTIPLPLYFPVDMEQEAENRLWLELDMQAERAEFLDSFERRVRAIRERRDRERSDGR